jgi:hypothetical protein
MRRRSFLAGLAAGPWVALAAATAWLQACGSDYNGGGTMSYAAACDGIAPTIGVSSGHTHPACITQADLNAGGDYTLMLQADGVGHTHTFPISAADMAALKAGSPPVAGGLSTTTNAHQHMVSFP